MPSWFSSPNASGKSIISTNTNVETKLVPGSNISVIITTTKTVYSDGSVNTETKTESGSTGSTYNKREPTTNGSCPMRKTTGELIAPTENAQEVKSVDDNSSSADFENSEFSAFERQALKAHNEYRKRHGAPPMKLSKKICQVSKNWANTIAARGQMVHSTGSGYGENIFWTSGEVDNGKPPVDAWYDEIKDHNFRRNTYQSDTGHFTQVVWKGSLELGIAEATGRNGTFVVANYYPQGNFQGQFDQNVLPPS